MKIAVRGGHTELCTGASALINELTEDRKVKDAVVKYLRTLGQDVLDVTPPVNYTSSASKDLAYGVNKANNYGANLFVSIHFNKAYDTYNGSLGSEVCVYSTNDYANRVVEKLGCLGFGNRGQKVRTGLYELNHTSMTAMIVEVCFVEATEDVNLYKKLGADAIGKAIAEAIVNTSTINVATPAPAPEKKTEAKAVESSFTNWVKRLQAECNAQGFSNQKVDGIPGPNTLAGCPLMRKGARGNITRLLQERLGVAQDGIFGSNTYNAVYNFQRNKGLSADGIVGRNTWRKLLNL